MVGLKNRKAEGWALDVSDSEDISLRQRLADNNKLWLTSLIIVILISAFLWHSAKNEKVEKQSMPPVRSNKAYSEADYMRFANNFKAQNEVVDAKFINEDKFRIVVPSEVRADDIEHMSTITAQKILHKFGHRVVIQVYFRNASGNEKLTAVTRWKPERYGFITDIQDND